MPSIEDYTLNSEVSVPIEHVGLSWSIGRHLGNGASTWYRGVLDQVLRPWVSVDGM